VGSALGFAVWLASAVALGAAAAPPDWEEIEGRDVELFQPGESSFEWALTKDDHSGGPKVRKGKHCAGCHEGEEGDIASDGAEELGFPPTLVANVKFARDDERLFVRLEWPALAPAAKQLSPDTEARATLLFDDGGVKEARVVGCWMTCHDDLSSMPEGPAEGERKKYIGHSRVKIRRSGGGDELKPQAELDRMRAEGEFLEYWQALLNRGKPAVPRDGWILATRQRNETPLASAEASFADGRWSVVLSRALAGGPGRKTIAPGGLYTFNLAIHDAHANDRFHYVSLEQTFALDGAKADWIVPR
jgi:cytochrome c-type protein NapC